jgi:hypothetical protein
MNMSNADMDDKPSGGTITSEPVWGWDCSNKNKPVDPCPMDTIIVKKGQPPPVDRCPKDGNNTWDKRPGDLVKVTRDSGAVKEIKIVDQAKNGEEVKGWVSPIVVRLLEGWEIKVP